MNVKMSIQRKCRIKVENKRPLVYKKIVPVYKENTQSHIEGNCKTKRRKCIVLADPPFLHISFRAQK